MSTKQKRDAQIGEADPVFASPREELNAELTWLAARKADLNLAVLDEISVLIDKYDDAMKKRVPRLSFGQRELLIFAMMVNIVILMFIHYKS